MAEKQPETLVEKKGRTSSVIWKHFGFQSSDEEQKEVVCKVCHAIVSAPQGNTTNVFNHLKFSHKVVYDQLLTEQKTQKRASTSATVTQSSIEDTLYNATIYPTGSRRQREITEAVTFMLAKDMCPISTVNNTGFKTLVKTMDKRYVLPSRKHFSRVALPALYDKCRAEVEKDISTAEYFATTTDLWSSRTMEPYIPLTVHYINADFTMKTKCLQTAFFPVDHTGVNIADGLKDAMAAWDLKEENHVCITIDNASNVKLAAELNGWIRLQCFGHRLHLAIENAMKDSRIDRAMGVCKKVVSTFSYSCKKKKELTKAQRELKLPEHSLKTECPTRWGSRQVMINRVLEQQKAIVQVLSNQKSDPQDIEVLEAIKAINNSQSPLVEFTDALSGEQYVSVSRVKPTLHLFHTSILAVEENGTDLSEHQAEDNGLPQREI
ncbi:Zinc finger BED domain-containing protein 1 [Merluccius polli]|uniref:Zinc finger BED domain-containing protein 1 n=1 Tax=Merluccius polli TaxID=89951 RepID=A0AA47P214_MERPO|nr:Zinc finger BED domain-containing protein 1 [Merluccius polli]